MSTSPFGSDRYVPANVAELLRDAAQRLTASGSDTPRLDAEVLLGHVLHVSRATLLAGGEAHVGADQQRQFEALVARRAAGEPVSYVRGLKEFYGLVFSVDKRALVPRPETETLVDLALARLAEMLTAAPRDAGSPLEVWDVGTGSGAIAVAVAVESRRRGYAADVHFLASDASAAALSLAIENAVSHGVADLIEFVTSDLVETAGRRADLLLANLPYVPSDVLPTLPVAATFEPVQALDGGPDGLALIRRLVAQLPVALRHGGSVLLEMGSDQADAVMEMTSALGDGWSSVVHDDLSGRPRVVDIRRAR
jgi:release factor glutamine methyltransferase